MLWTLIVVLAILWLLGVLLTYTLGGLIHLLLIAAIILLIVKIVQNIRRKSDKV